MATRYVDTDTVPLEHENGKKLRELLWGDQVRADTFPSSGRVKVKARGLTGYIDVKYLGTRSLLELYFVDVGQGDGVLVRFPDGRHILIDGGYNRAKQPTRKNAADFVDWKFFKDYGQTKIKLDAMVASHCDADHYGGLWDLVNPDEKQDLDTTSVEVGAFYHAGVSWWSDPAVDKNGKPTTKRSLGPTKSGYLTRLLGDEADAAHWLAGSNGTKLQGEWAQFIRCLVDNGVPIRRLSHVDNFLPDFDPSSGSDVQVRTLGPVEYELDGKPVVRSLGSVSQNTNGQSIVLRFDYGRIRILLTGDLNKKAQQGLLDAYAGEESEFAVDVVKGCHHGSDDCSYSFLEKVHAACTVISSGDNEGHAHPRPTIVAASGQTGYRTTRNDDILTPMIYSTEISRSYRIGTPKKLTVDGDDAEIEKAVIEYDEITAGALSAKKGKKSLDRLLVVPGIVYGLVNVRTDGEKVLCATMNEKDGSWDVKTFEGRF